ncbi:trace amine-associated receptor 1b [Hoplias malabaricus]|uniref:trace amine-associated receptor 1b n=1 Tax=Hoplias malabaricus TaxID=27720 RepID=UPI0034624230
MAITILVTITGNLLVIVSIAHFKQLHTPTNHLILSLAMCDFMLGIFVMPLSAMRSVHGCWYLADIICKLHTVLCMVSTSWVISAVFAYTMVFTGLNLKGAEAFYDTHVRCIGGCHVFFSRASAVVTSMVSFFIPGLIMFGIYSRIFVVARGQARSIDFLTNQLRMTSNKSGEFRYRTRKGTMTLAVVVGVFLICWTPFFLCNIIDPFIDFSIPPTLIDALVWFGYLNSTLNPFIYAFLYPWFRKALKIILSGELFHRNSCRIQLYS